MEIDSAKRFKIIDKCGTYIGNGTVDEVLTEDNPQYIDRYIIAYIVRFDDGTVKCCPVKTYDLTPILES